MALRRPRQERRRIIKQLVGHHYSDEGTAEPVPVNLIAQYVSIVGRGLIAKNPRVSLTTFNQNAKAIVSAMEAWANDELPRMKFAQTMQQIVTDALIKFGIAKVALATPSDAATYAWNLGAAEPFISRVSLDDWVHDVQGTDPATWQFCGHRYRVPLDTIQDSKLYNKAAREKLTASSNPTHNREGDERAEMIARTYYGSKDDFEDMVDLWEIYLPRHKLVVTLADDWLTGPHGMPDELGEDSALRIQNWVGPPSGPYLLLGYQWIPDQAMPKGPLEDQMDNHLIVNETVKKMAWSTDNLKENVVYDSQYAEEAERFEKSRHMQMIGTKSPDAVKSIMIGGVSLQPLTGMMKVFADLFSKQAGNLELRGGLSPQSKTAHQDAMLNENGSRTDQDMQDRTVAFVTDVLTNYLWFCHHHPMKVMRSKWSSPGLSTDVGITQQVTPQQRQTIAWEDLEMQVDPYSMMHSTPQGRLQALEQTVMNIVIPMMPFLQQAGETFDLGKFLDIVAKLSDSPELADCRTISEAMVPPSGGGGPHERIPGGPAETVHTRRNVSQGDDGGIEQLLSSAGASGSNGMPKPSMNGI